MQIKSPFSPLDLGDGMPILKVGYVHAVLAAWLGFVTLVALIMPEKALFLLIGTTVAALGFAAFLFPGLALILGMISSMISVENFLFFKNFTLNNDSFLNSSSFHKVILLALMMPAILRYGLKSRMNPVIMALVMMFLATFVFSTRLPGLDNAQVLQTLVGLAMPFIVFNMRLKPQWVDSHLTILAWFPIISIVLAYGAEFAGLKDTLGGSWANIRFEAFTGAYRMGGINIPASLAALAFVGFVISIFQAVLYQKKGYYGLAGLMVLITVFTGTRAPLAVEIIFAGLGILISSNQDLRASAKLNFGIIGAVLLAVILIAYWPNLEARFVRQGSGEGLNTSGRTQIWDIEYQAFEQNPLFGRGLGAGAIILLDQEWQNLKEARATHNEFLRLLVDGGIVGLSAYLVGLFLLIRPECRGVNKTAGRLICVLFFAFAIYSFTDNTISSNYTLIFFYAVALLLYQAQLAAQREEPPEIRRPGLNFA